MDVVKQSIDKAGGRVRVSSSTNQGSEFSIFLPQNVSTKIIDGYLIKSHSGNIYVLPMKAVIEAFVPAREEIFSVRQSSRMIRRRDGVYPLLDLAVLNPGVDSSERQGEAEDRATSVLLEVHGNIFALRVQEIIGVQKVVVNKIDGIDCRDQIFEGAAVLGNGQIALIIGEQGLQQLAGSGA